MRRKKVNWIGYLVRGKSLLITVIGGKCDGKRGNGRRKYQMVDSVSIGGKCEQQKDLLKT